MTTVNLIESVAAEIKAVTKNLRLPLEYHGTRSNAVQRAVHVYEQQIPHDLFESDEYFPCCTVEFLSLHDTVRGTDVKSIATIGLSCGVFAKESYAWRDCFHLTELCRQRLLSVRTLAEKFRLADDITWEAPPQQPTPFFILLAELNYEIYQPQEPFSMQEPDLIDSHPPKVLKSNAFERTIR